MWWSKRMTYKYRLLPILLAFWLLMTSSGSAHHLSDSAMISVITCGPGQPLYAAFGHTAIRVKDYENHLDLVFNYGTFDFKQRFFYLKFLTGKLEYSLTISDFEEFYTEYVSENRNIYEQILHFDKNLLNLIYDSLKINSLIEFRNYRYDFFEDNCTTRAMNIIVHFLPDSLRNEFFNQPVSTTFRKEIEKAVGHRSWLMMGINILLGKYADQPVSYKQSLFLPENFMKSLSKSQWAGEPKIIFENETQHTGRGSDFLFSTSIVIWLLALLLIAEVLTSFTSQSFSDRTDIVLFALTGILGCLFLFLRIFSEHIPLQSNLNILWANPLNLIISVLLFTGWKKTAHFFIAIVVTGIAFCLVTWHHIPQHLPPDLMPILGLLAVRMLQRLFVFVKKPE